VQHHRQRRREEPGVLGGDGAPPDSSARRTMPATLGTTLSAMRAAGTSQSRLVDVVGRSCDDGARRAAAWRPSARTAWAAIGEAEATAAAGVQPARPRAAAH
jgi:hypothetical protein